MKGLLIQEVKTLFKSPAALSILIIPIVLMLGLGFILPSGWIIPSSITIGIVGSVLLYFGGSIEEIKRTSFMKSISLTRMNKFTYLSTKILFSILVSLFSVLWVLFFGWMFTDVIPLLVTDFSALIPSGTSDMMDFVRTISFEVDWTNINWILMLYAGAITIIVSTSLAFVFVAFSKSSLSFYLMSFGYLLAMILFGGIIMPSALISPDNSWFKIFYYLVPNFYTNNIMATSFGNGMDTIVQNILIPLDKIIDIDYIRLGNLVKVFNGNLVASILGYFVLPNFNPIPQNAIDSFNNMSSEELSIVSEKLDEFLSFNFYTNWGVLYSVWEKGKAPIDEMNDFELWLYSVMTEPLINENVTSWKSLIGSKLDLVLNQWLNLDIGLIKIGLILNSIMVLINRFSGSGEIYSFIAGYKETILGLLCNDQILIAILNNDLFSRGLAILINAFGKMDPNGVFGIGLNLDYNITEKIQGTIDKLLSDFAPAMTLDYVLPWVETGIFLGLSTTFFKWS